MFGITSNLSVCSFSRIVRSLVLVIELVSDIGLQFCGYFLGFGIIITVASFQLFGKCARLSIVFAIFLISTTPFLGRCFNVLFDILSEPSAFLLFSPLIFSLTSFGATDLISFKISSMAVLPETRRLYGCDTISSDQY